MKKISLFAKLSLLSVFFISLLFVNSCKDKTKDDDTTLPKPTQNIYQIISAAKYSIFKAGVDKAGLADMLKSTTSYTLYAPTDDVFTAAGILNFDSKDPIEIAKLVKLHMMAGVQTYGSFGVSGYHPTLHNGGPSGTAISANVAVSSNVLSVNGQQVLFSTAATNGIVHDVGDLLVWHDKIGTWRVPTMYDLISFSAILSQYRVAVDLETATTKAYFSGTDLYTAFATDNDGIIKYLKSVSKSWNSLSGNERRRILNNGTLVGNIRSSALTSGSQVTKGDPLKLLVAGSAITLNDSVSVKITDAQAVNGVIHVVDKTLNY